MQVNTFQVALVFNNGSSFVFFNYDKVVPSRSSSLTLAGLSPSRVRDTRDSIVIPEVLDGSENLANLSNTGEPGFYAYRVDQTFIVEPTGIALT